MAKIRIGLSSKRDQARIVIEEHPRSMTVVLDTSATSNLLTKLGRARSDMIPSVAAKQPAEPLVRAVPDPVIEVEGEAMESLTLLNLRDPRFGWLHYSLKPEQARQLGEALIRQSLTRVVQKPGRKTN